MKPPFAPYVVLNNGIKMPQLGLGVALIPTQEQTAETVFSAIEQGYRLIDTAARYENEEGVGMGIRRSGVARGEIFLTTKVRNRDLGYQNTLRGFEESLERLQTDYIDLYLLHWPIPGYVEDSWKAICEIYRSGRARAIGVCNCTPTVLVQLINSGIIPAVNQVECHPLLTREDIRAVCSRHRIAFEAWSPLMQGHMDIPLLHALAQKYRKSPAQIVLRWHIQRGTVVIPKTVTPSRMAENADVFDFYMEPDDMELLCALNENRNFGPGIDDILKNMTLSTFEMPPQTAAVKRK